LETKHDAPFGRRVRQQFRKQMIASRFQADDRRVAGGERLGGSMQVHPVAGKMKIATNAIDSKPIFPDEFVVTVQQKMDFTARVGEHAAVKSTESPCANDAISYGIR